MHFIVRIVFICLLFSFCAHADELTAEEREVWELEKTYYRLAKNNDPEGYLRLFNETTIGWPTFDPRPRGKDKASQWIGHVHSKPLETWQYEIERYAIQSFGDVVVVHYRLKDYFVSTETGEELQSQEFRISHTWMRRNGRWQIISGMGGKFN